MSYCHIRLVRSTFNDESVSYRIYCPDFNTDFKAEYLGTIEYSRLAHSFRHIDNELWVKNRIYPIELFEMEEEERKRTIQAKYGDYSAGTWSMKVWSFIREYLKREVFPSEKELLS